MDDAPHILTINAHAETSVHRTILNGEGFVKLSMMLFFTSESVPLKNMSTRRAWTT